MKIDTNDLKNKVTKIEPTSSMTRPRKMMLIAIIVQFITMFIGVQDTDNFVGITTLSGSMTFYPHTADLTGAQVHPIGPFLLVGFFLMFATALYHIPFWKRYGYISTVVLMFVFTTGGAVFRVFGGLISFSAWILACVAAYKNHKQSKAEATNGAEGPAEDLPKSLVSEVDEEDRKIRQSKRKQAISNDQGAVKTDDMFFKEPPE